MCKILRAAPGTERAHSEAVGILTPPDESTLPPPSQRPSLGDALSSTSRHPSSLSTELQPERAAEVQQPLCPQTVPQVRSPSRTPEARPIWAQASPVTPAPWRWQALQAPPPVPGPSPLQRLTPSRPTSESSYFVLRPLPGKHPELDLSHRRLQSSHSTCLQPPKGLAPFARSGKSHAGTKAAPRPSALCPWHGASQASGSLGTMTCLQPCHWWWEQGRFFGETSVLGSACLPPEV